MLWALFSSRQRNPKEKWGDASQKKGIQAEILLMGANKTWRLPEMTTSVCLNVTLPPGFRTVPGSQEVLQRDLLNEHEKVDKAKMRQEQSCQDKLMQWNTRHVWDPVLSTAEDNGRQLDGESVANWGHVVGFGSDSKRNWNPVWSFKSGSDVIHAHFEDVT